MPTLLDQPPAGLLPKELISGDRLTQREFHEIYSRMPKHVRAELIGGIVYVASPMKRAHGRNQGPLLTVLQMYESRTPGVECGLSTTFIMDEDNEPQPDLSLIVNPEYGGQCLEDDHGYFNGAPEFVCEVSDSTRSTDLNAKRREYQSAGVLDYLVLNLRDERLHWYDFARNEELQAGEDGILRIRAFPGLWIHGPALIARDATQLLATLQLGLATPEHAEFVKQLEARRAAHAQA
jgi:Uma2 family endonuclease